MTKLIEPIHSAGTRGAMKQAVKEHQSMLAKPHAHQWTDWKEIGRTGDWFHPLIVERKCLLCGATETDEH